MDEMVDRYLTVIRSVRGTGPYRLLGWSFGGLVAHALAARLQEQGERVEFLAMLDTHPRVPSRLRHAGTGRTCWPISCTSSTCRPMRR